MKRSTVCLPRSDLPQHLALDLMVITNDTFGDFPIALYGGAVFKIIDGGLHRWNPTEKIWLDDESLHDCADRICLKEALRSFQAPALESESFGDTQSTRFERR